VCESLNELAVLSNFFNKSEQEMMRIMKRLTKKELAKLDAILWSFERDSTPKMKDFLVQSWSTLLPFTDFVDNWHIDAICDYLQAVIEGKIQNLVILMPPRHMKSISVSVAFPCYTWLLHPQKQFLYASHSQRLAIRDNLACRRLITSSWYQKNWGSRFKLTEAASTKISNNKTGYRMITSVDAGVTGENADVCVGDDLHNATDSQSDLINERTIMFWDEAMSSRLNNPKTGARIIVMQPVSERDISAHVLEQGGYECLCLPCEYYKTPFISSIGFEDPRTEPGELLWPDRFGEKEIDEYKKRLGEYAFATQFQMERSPRGGGIIKNAWWRYYEPEYTITYRVIKPKFDRIVISWDTAFKEGQLNDYCAGTFWGINNTGAYLFHVIRKKMNFPELLKTVVESALKYNPNALLIEDCASGQSLIQSVKKETQLPVIAVKVDRDKESRLHAIAPFIESGRVFVIKDANWANDYMHELEAFPNAAHDDLVDSTTQALNYMFLKSKAQVVNNVSIFGR
jgi:predicted phage terminase large subunit-like protein